MKAQRNASGGQTNSRLVNGGVATGKVGGAMTGRNGLAIVSKQSVNKAKKATAQTGIGLREGTTGRIVTTLARVWAVAAPSVADAAAEEAAGPFKAVRGRVIPLDASRAVTNQLTGGRVRAVPARSEGRVGPVAVGRVECKPAAAAKPARVELPEFEVRFYRKYTEALLGRYMQMTMEAGRVPSMMGREVLGGRASSYRIHGFDDAVNFRLDVERCLALLNGNERELLRRISLQEYTQAEAAALIGISLRTCVQRYGRALDKLTAILLEMRLLEPFKALSRG